MVRPLLGEHVTEDPAKTFHSFRHTFKRACREAGLGEEIDNALTGHSGGGVGRSYGRERLESGGLDRGISMARLKLLNLAKGQLPKANGTGLTPAEQLISN